ncbi:MAG TPA: right-handed parallel beta-helix repeat-containing protein, partial [Planctomycetaceae bacterium]
LRFTGRSRNVLIDHCHVFHNRGIGIHFDSVNLHQIVVSASHVSYCRLGGVRIDGRCEVRNVQITGCDVEYNNNRSHGVPGADAEPTAEIFLDARDGTIREGTITGCTVQATDSENGANVRLLGSAEGEPGTAGMWAITGNLIGSQRDNVHLSGVAGVTLTGNFLYSGHRRNVLVERSANVVIAANSFGHNQDYEGKQLRTGIRIVDSADVAISGVVLRDAAAGRHTVETAGPSERLAPLELIRCRRVNVSGTQILDGAPNGIYVEDCVDAVFTGCTILESRPDRLMSAAIRWTGDAAGGLIAACRIGRGTEGAIVAPEQVRRETNVEG